MQFSTDQTSSMRTFIVDEILSCVCGVTLTKGPVNCVEIRAVLVDWMLIVGVGCDCRTCLHSSACDESDFNVMKVSQSLATALPEFVANDHCRDATRYVCWYGCTCPKFQKRQSETPDLTYSPPRSSSLRNTGSTRKQSDKQTGPGGSFIIRTTLLHPENRVKRSVAVKVANACR